MCGICMVLEFSLVSLDLHCKVTAPYIESLQRRGPDGSHHVTLQEGRAALSLHGSVLWLQGARPTPQPVVDQAGSVLLWNGDVLAGLRVPDGQSDTSFLSHILCNKSQDEILTVFSAIKGPWSMVYYQSTSKHLYFARDVLGRHSLLWSEHRNSAVCKEPSSTVSSDAMLPSDGEGVSKENIALNKSSSISKFILTSVGKISDGLEEVPAHGIYFIDLNNCFEKDHNHKEKIAIHLIPWDCVSKSNLLGVDVHLSIKEIKSPIGISLNTTIPNAGNHPILELSDKNYENFSELSSLEYFDDDVHELSTLLKASISRRVQACPPCCLDCSDVGRCKHCRIAVLFSGGLDSAIIALLLDKCLPANQIIDLINVAFPKKSTQIQPTKKSKVKQRKKNTNIENKVVVSTNPLDCVEKCVASRVTQTSAECREDTDSRMCSNGDEMADTGQSESLINNRVGNECMNSSDVLRGDSQFDVPDRITGRVCYEQLKQICPNRKFNFVEVNVSRDELCRHRTERISDLLHPQCSVLDDSIGCALWFAARGAGHVQGVHYTSPARVILCGMGADEQFCGYSRHRTCYSRHGWEGLLREVQMEMERLHSRNLGRDNRILADHARAPRFPYLDEDLIAYLNSLPICNKANLQLPRGVGEKLLLRVTAHRLGLTYAATLPKRAIQFGSRIAKMENKKESGAEVCHRLKQITLE